MSNYQGPRPAWTIWNHNKLRLAGVPWDSSKPKDRPSCMTKVVNNNPRFNVYMNNGRDDRPQSYKVDPHIFFAIMETIHKVADTPKQTRWEFELKTSFPGGQRVDTPVIDGKIIVGRDGDGLVFIGFIKHKKDLAKFNFIPSYWAGLNGEGIDGDPKIESSNIMAKGWATQMSELVGAYLVHDAKEPEQRPGTYGQQSGGNNYGGGSSADNSGFSDDVPF